MASSIGYTVHSEIEAITGLYRFAACERLPSQTRYIVVLTEGATVLNNKNMNIYFHIDELNRDAIVASALKRKLAQKGHNLIYGNRATNSLLKYLHSAFDIIVIPRPHMAYDNWGDDWMEWDARFVMLSTESLGMLCLDHHVMAKTLLEREYFEGKRKYVARIDAFCFWGSEQFQAVKNYAAEISYKCHTVGHPRHDTSCLNDQRINATRTPQTKKVIGVTTRAIGLNDYFGRNPLYPYVTLFSDHFQYEFINKTTGEKLPSKRVGAKPTETLIVQAIDVENTLKTIDSLVKAGYEVSVRVHPKENADVWKDLLKRCNLSAEISNSRLPMANWLKSVDYVVGPPSTSFYDAVMLGVTPISICQLDSRRKEYVGELWEDNNRLMQHIFKPKTIEDLLDYINKGVRNFNSNEILSILKEEADFPACRNSLNNVIAVCLADAATQKNRKFSLILFIFSRYIFFKVWRIKNKIIGRKENSASFAIGRKETRFIDGLTSAV